MTDIACAVVVAPSASWRNSRCLGWMSSPISYAIGTPLLTASGLVVSLMISRFISPREFGAYVLLLDLCRYAMRSDLGLTQLADRRIAGGFDIGLGAGGEADQILAARWRLGVIALLVATPVAMALAALSSTLAPIDAGLAIATGVMAMIAGGPSSIYRARGDVWMYTALSFAFGIGFIVPRLLGIACYGTTGCFAFLLIWYIFAAAVFTRDFAAPHRVRVDLVAMVRTALPMFVFAAVWTLYLSAGRWVAASLCEPAAFGLFAFSTNLVFTGVVTVGITADVRYPYWLGRLAADGKYACSVGIAREAGILAIAVVAAVAALVPLAPRLLHLLFPGYGAALSPLLALACSGVPLAVVAWFLPVVIAMAARPVRDAAIVFVPATLVLVIVMIVGERLGGVEGQAWSYAASALTALAGMTFVLVRAEILSRRAAICFFSAPAACTAFAMLVVLASHFSGQS